MQTGRQHRLDRLLERILPERRLFLRSENSSQTKFVILRPTTQAVAWLSVAFLLAWAIVSTSILLMDNIGAGTLRAQAERDAITYRERLNALAAERDMRAQEALTAQSRFNAALTQVSDMQSELLAAATRATELELGMEAFQTTLSEVLEERDAARAQLATLAEQQTAPQGSEPDPTIALPETVAFLSSALTATAAERDAVSSSAQEATEYADEMAWQLETIEDRNDDIFRSLEEAMTVSVEPLDKMFKAAGMNPDLVLRKVRAGYSGQGGPLTPLTLSSKGTDPSEDETRAKRLLSQMDRLNLYRIAAQKAPFATPVKAAFRFTSPFGVRRDPKTGGRRMHNGVDFAAPNGTPLYSTADGVVTHAGWSSGYGRLVKIQHEFGIETRYAHMSKIRVRVGQRVTRGQRIGDMGASGRVTGVHLHYEVRVGGKPVNPMIYIKAADDVF
ncbi:MAG: M23 family metallopeptidase [Pseudomonadota bacterium]